MFQTLVIIASLVVLCGAILTSTLVTARATLHQAVVAKTNTAMTDATSQFLGWAQNFVYRYGPEADWNAAGVAAQPLFHPMCAAANTTTCAFGMTARWKVTGATKGVAPAAAAARQPLSQAQNMAPAVDEQRISATISVIVSDASGRRVYGGRTREVTARVFDASPYVVITAVRDLSSRVGTTSQSEGDTGGVASVQRLNANQGKPDPTRPASYVDTTLKTTIDCSNTSGFDQANPTSPLDVGKQINYAYRNYGARIWAYETPCEPTAGVPVPTHYPPGYFPPLGPTYAIGVPDQSETWQKADTNQTSFPR